MIPIIALMIAVYGSARLLNDGCKRHPNNPMATVFTWILGIVAVMLLWLLALMCNAAGMHQ